MEGSFETTGSNFSSPNMTMNDLTMVGGLELDSSDRVQHSDGSSSFLVNEKESAKKLPRKSLFKLEEVCGLTEVRPHVLKFWETEFKELGPVTSASGQKLYEEKDIEVIQTIKTFVYLEQLTLDEIKKRLAEMYPSSSPGTSVEAESKNVRRNKQDATTVENLNIDSNSNREVCKIGSEISSEVESKVSSSSDSTVESQVEDKNKIEEELPSEVLSKEALSINNSLSFNELLAYHEDLVPVPPISKRTYKLSDQSIMIINQVRNELQEIIRCAEAIKKKHIRDYKI